jgi:hypothetical protein
MLMILYFIEVWKKFWFKTNTYLYTLSEIYLFFRDSLWLFLGIANFHKGENLERDYLSHS